MSSSFFTILAGLIALALFVYLLYALLRAEKF
ncbi:K(+)-transporting ATPase subunit F [Alcaligenes sp. SDU_A2]|nr:K(+)-transporting ATPase subunit F [Alcaligenes sp.]HRL27988.1 K(+)-transporting ATPase subunit F [Alcaligenes sp.]